MNTEISNAAICYGLYDKNEIIGFMGILHHPDRRNHKMKRVSRLVILPEYQGIGLGVKFLTVMAKYYNKCGYDLCIITSARNLIDALRKNKDWLCYRFGRVGKSAGKNALIKKHRDVGTASFIYRPKKGENDGKTENKNR